MMKKIIELILLFVFLAAAFFLWYIYLFKGHKITYKDVQDKFQQLFVESSRSKPQVTPTPKRFIYPLPAGVQSYNFSHGKGVVGPKLGKVTIDPLTPKNGEKQTVTITVKNDSPVTSAEAVLYTDSGHHSYPFKLIGGTTKDGSWETSWNISDTYNYIYKINFILKSPTGNWQGPLTFRQ